MAPVSYIVRCVDHSTYQCQELFQGGSHSVYSDLWSLGCVLYELASGSPPFVGQTFESLVDAILNQEVQSLPNFSAEFNDLIRCLLQKKPSDRITWDVSLFENFGSVIHTIATSGCASIHSGRNHCGFQLKTNRSS